jgi:preprotein translocase subunit YajC
MLLMGAPPEGSSPNLFVAIIPYLLILLIFYYLLIRPQQKRAQEHRKFVASLKKGDSVVTESGMFGTIVSLDDDSVVLKIADNVKVRFLRVKLASPASRVAAEPARKKNRSGGRGTS